MLHQTSPRAGKRSAVCSLEQLCDNTSFFADSHMKDRKWRVAPRRGGEISCAFLSRATKYIEFAFSFEMRYAYSIMNNIQLLFSTCNGLKFSLKNPRKSWLRKSMNTMLLYAEFTILYYLCISCPSSCFFLSCRSTWEGRWLWVWSHDSSFFKRNIQA